MRSLWNGSIGFGLVSIPVRLYPAVSPKDVRFHEIDRRTGRRVRRRKIVREEKPPAAPPETVARPAERALAAEEVVKGYEVEPGRIVQLEREEIEELRPEQTKVIEIEHFVKLADIDPVYFEKSYYVAPAEELAHRPYALLRETMEATGRVAIGRFVLRTKEHLVAIRPTSGVLGLETLYFADEVNEPAPAWLAALSEKVAARELKLSAALIDALAAEWEPQAYEDRDRARLMDLIESRAPREVEPEEAEATVAGPKVSDLMEALKASVEAVKAEKPKRKPAHRARG